MASREAAAVADLQAAIKQLHQTQAALHQAAASLLAACDPSATQSAVTSARQQTAASLSRLADILNQIAQFSLSVAAVFQTKLVQETEQLEHQPIGASPSDGGRPIHEADLLLQLKGVRDVMAELTETMSSLSPAAASRHAALTSSMLSPADTSTGATFSPAATATSATLSPPASQTTVTLSPPAGSRFPQQRQGDVFGDEQQQRSEQ